MCSEVWTQGCALDTMYCTLPDRIKVKYHQDLQTNLGLQLGCHALRGGLTSQVVAMPLYARCQEGADFCRGGATLTSTWYAVMADP